MLSKRGKNRLRQAPFVLKFLSLFVVFLYIHMFCETLVGFRNKARILNYSRNTHIHLLYIRIYKMISRIKKAKDGICDIHHLSGYLLREKQIWQRSQEKEGGSYQESQPPSSNPSGVIIFYVKYFI